MSLEELLPIYFILEIRFWHNKKNYCDSQIPSVLKLKGCHVCVKCVSNGSITFFKIFCPKHTK